MDECDRLWVMDTGLADILGKPKQYAPNALVIFDLKTDQLIRRYTFPSSDVQSGTFFANVVCISSLHSLCLRVYVARVKAVKIFLLLFFFHFDCRLSMYKKMIAKMRTLIFPIWAPTVLSSTHLKTINHGAPPITISISIH